MTLTYLEEVTDEGLLRNTQTKLWTLTFERWATIVRARFSKFSYWCCMRQELRLCRVQRSISEWGTGWYRGIVFGAKVHLRNTENGDPIGKPSVHDFVDQRCHRLSMVVELSRQDSFKNLIRISAIMLVVEHTLIRYRTHWEGMRRLLWKSSKRSIWSSASWRICDPWDNG